LFRIDRRLVNVSGIKFNKFDTDENENPEVGAEGDTPDAATSAETVLNEYLYAARTETESKMEEILEKARDQAAQIILDARDDAEEERQRGFREGFEEGSEEGKRVYDDKIAEKVREYDEQLRNKIDEDDEALKNVLNEVYEERERTNSAMEESVTKLAIEIVRKIINPAEEELENVYTSLIKNALRQVPNEGKVVLRVGANEYERFFSSGATTIELDSGVTVKAAVIRDVALNDGDCIIDTDDVTINAGVDSQLQYVKLAFERANQYEPS